ncbi:MAG TPA: hypothetical protein VFP22_06385 [Candidatus Limnocylindrales bacterium]|nr:hypothetical protein [Candidatus Limnocylindrales bacterium]
MRRGLADLRRRFAAAHDDVVIESAGGETAGPAYVSRLDRLLEASAGPPEATAGKEPVAPAAKKGKRRPAATSRHAATGR